MCRVVCLVVSMLLLLPLLPCLAQTSREAKQIEESSGLSTDNPETVAILPWIYDDGTPGARKAAKEFLQTLLTKSLYFREDSFQFIPEERVVRTWTVDMGHDLALERAGIPTPKELLRLGQKLRVDWVITGHARWHTRSVWIGLGPKTKSDCTVDMVIVDVKKRELSLDARKVKLDSAPREDPLKAATVVLLGVATGGGRLITTLPLTMVSGGPKTPAEQNAAQAAILTAIRPWLALHPHNRKIETDDEPQSDDGHSMDSGQRESDR